MSETEKKTEGKAYKKTEEKAYNNGEKQEVFILKNNIQLN